MGCEVHDASNSSGWKQERPSSADCAYILSYYVARQNPKQIVFHPTENFRISGSKKTDPPTSRTETPSRCRAHRLKFGGWRQDFIGIRGPRGGSTKLKQLIEKLHKKSKLSGFWYSLASAFCQDHLRGQSCPQGREINSPT